MTTKSKPKRNEIADAIRETLTSPNESDSNGEEACVVDGLFAIARAIRFLGKATCRGPCGAQHEYDLEHRCKWCGRLDLEPAQ